MEIRKIGFASFKMDFADVTIITDPLLSEKSGDKIPSHEADVVLYSEKEYIGRHEILKEYGVTKLTPRERGKIMEICSPGDYEIGGVIVRRSIDTNFYVLDEGEIRIVYFGYGFGEVKAEKLKDLGDVDVLILPVCGIEPYATYEEVYKVISIIDPTKLLPTMFASGKELSSPFKEVKDISEFIKDAGYTHVSEEKKIKIVKGIEDDTKVMEVLILS